MSSLPCPFNRSEKVQRMLGSTASILIIADLDSRGRSLKIDSAPPEVNVLVEEIEAARSRLACCSCRADGLRVDL
jgi:hypothetical protein